VGLLDGRPFRIGTHENSVFALAAALDYARVTSINGLEVDVLETLGEFFRSDEESPVEYEPLGWDFPSPALGEADLMRRVLDPESG